jgi:ribosome-binding factor A
MEYSEDWPIDRSYIKREKVQEALERGRAFLAAQTASRRGYKMAPKLRTQLDTASKNSPPLEGFI